MILRVIKTYKSNKIALCVGIVEHAIATLETEATFLRIKEEVVVGQVIDLGDAKVSVVPCKGKDGIMYNYFKLSL